MTDYIAKLQRVRSPGRAAMLVRAHGCQAAAMICYEQRPAEAYRIARRCNNDADTIERCTTMGQVHAYLRAAGYKYGRKTA